jgi:hypothetical protein
MIKRLKKSLFGTREPSKANMSLWEELLLCKKKLDEHEVIINDLRTKLDETKRQLSDREQLIGEIKELVYGYENNLQESIYGGRWRKSVQLVDQNWDLLMKELDDLTGVEPPSEPQIG